LTDPKADPSEMINVADSPALAEVRKSLSELVQKYTRRYTPQ
jgi:hypothetical protein